MYCCVIFLKRLLGGPPLLGACSARGPEVWKFELIMQLITGTVKDKIQAKKEKRHKRSDTSKKNKLDTGKSRSRHKSRPRQKAGLTPLTASPPQIYPVHLALIMSISNLDIVRVMVPSILDLTLVLIKVILRKISKERDPRQQQQTLSLRYMWILK